MSSLSIIVPFYDETAYIRTALRSIRAQSTPDIDIIVVNDNPDKFSATQIETLVAGFGPVTLLQHETNRGLSQARNTGMAVATGRFIGFLDADDYYMIGGLDRQLSLAMSENADMAHAQTYVTARGSADHRLLRRDRLLFGDRKSSSGLLGAEAAQFIASSWSSLYSRDFLLENDLRFDTEQRKFEDRLFVLHAVTRAKHLAFLGAPTRVWRGRAGSISVSSGTPETHLLQIKLLEKCLAHMRKEHASGRVPLRMLRREVFNTVSRIVWDLELLPAVLGSDLPVYADIAERIPAMLGDDRFGHAIFEDPVLAPISRVGMVTRLGRVSRSAFFDIHRSLRDGELQKAADVISQCASPTAPFVQLNQKGPKLLLHVGMHKTGSTFIQHNLLAHRGALLSAGWLFPKAGFDVPVDPIRAGATPGHHGLVAALRKNDEIAWQALRNEIRKTKPETVILSCENFLFPTAHDRTELLQQLARRLSGFAEIQPIALVRRFDVYIEALYRERVAGGLPMGTAKLPGFLNDFTNSLCDFPALFGPMELALHARVRFGDFDADKTKGLWRSFAKLADLPRDLEDVDAPRYPTPDRTSTEVAALINMTIGNPDRRRQMLKGWFAQRALNGDSASMIPPSRRADLLIRWSDASAGFAADRGYSPDLAVALKELLHENWEPPGPIDTDVLATLNDLSAMARTMTVPPPVPPVPKRPDTPQHVPPPTKNKTRSPDPRYALTVRLRPWAARIVDSARRLSGSKPNMDG